MQVRPPERAQLPRKLRPPLQAFIRHLLRDVLSQDTLQAVRIVFDDFSSRHRRCHGN